MDDSLVWEEMFNYCDWTKSGSASSVQKEICCGLNNINCVPSSCTLQTRWSVGNKIVLLIHGCAFRGSTLE